MSSSERKKLALLVLSVAGIYGAYLTQGVVQERLSTTEYEPSNSKFTPLLFLNFAQSTMCFVWAWLWMRVFGGDSAEGAPASMYVWHSVTNSVGPACGVIALKNISFPAQVLAKSCKMIPVMVMGVLRFGKKYTSMEYFAAVLIAGGISVFALAKDSAKARAKLASPNALLGYTLCLINLVFDGYTNAKQDSIKDAFPKTSSVQLMCYTNLWCMCFLGAYVFLAVGDGVAAVSFSLTHPAAALDILLYCVCGAVGQNFIFFTIATFGSLTNTTITTTRKFFNILLSVVINGTVLKPEQWFGVGMVFGGVSLATWEKQQRSTKRHGLKAKE
mmetsp:Transcript_28130/g.91909  ORF Transcript_28130/g.91909 Transcript_28130/m.91909 type:complete len:330 (+) Transcript_28130:118-1107(+)